MFLIVLIFLGFSLQTGSVDTFPHGQIIDSVRIAGSPHYSYALYLPSHYDPEKKWPVIFGLDPAARGKKPVEVFKKMADKYGYILAGSNNSRNGPLKKSLPPIFAMIEDVGQKFNLDKKRVYLAGFSGGSRVASYIAFRFPDVTGVIACGAGLLPTLHLNNGLHFSYVSTVGNADMNFLEMKELYDDMNGINIPHYLIVFNGTHQWPDSASAGEAIRWLQLDAMRRHLVKTNKHFVQRYFTSQIQKANHDQQKRDYIDSYRTLQQIQRDFKTFSFISLKPVTDKIHNLDHSRSFRVAQKKERKITDLELDRLQKYEDALKKIMNIRFDRAGELKSPMWWKKQIREIQDFEKSRDRDYVLLGKRLDQYLNAQIYVYQHTIDNSWHDYHRLVWIDQVWSLLHPKSPKVQYELARAFVLDKQIKNGMTALRKAIDLGYKNDQNLKTNPDFEKVRDLPEFQKLLGKMSTTD